MISAPQLVNHLEKGSGRPVRQRIICVTLNLGPDFHIEDLRY